MRYIRYADDFIVLLRDGERADELKRELADYIGQELKMTLSDEKTHITNARDGFDFLGVRTFVGRQRSNPTKLLPYQVPAEKSVRAYRQKVNELTNPDLDYLPPGERIRSISWLIAGWANYHRWGNAKRTFSELNYWTIKKVHTMLRRYTASRKENHLCIVLPTCVGMRQPPTVEEIHPLANPFCTNSGGSAPGYLAHEHHFHRNVLEIQG